MEEPSFAARYKAYFSGEHNASRCQNGEVRIWSTEDARLQSSLPLPACQVTSVALIPQGELLAVAGWIPEKGGMLSIWNMTDGKQVRELTSQGGEGIVCCRIPRRSHVGQWRCRR